MLGIEFLHSPWWLLLIPLGVIVVLIPYLRVAKKYRRTRNRVTSVVLHILILIFSVCVLSGMLFTYHIPNEENVILLLVDVSDSEQEAEEARNQFIQTTLEYSRYDGFTVGIVTFGFDQVQAVPFTTEIDEIYDTYLEAAKPDTTATNIADALRYSMDLLEDYPVSKIVLVTDGKETDEEAEKVVKSLVAKGIRMDVANLSSGLEEKDAQITDVIFPEYHLGVGEEASITVTFECTDNVEITVNLYDNDVLDAAAVKALNLAKGTQSIVFTHAFATQGLHNVRFEISETDALEENNQYTSYYYLEEFTKILMLERVENESAALVSLLKENEETEYEVEVMQIEDAPVDVNALRMYDQIILNNIANKNMPLGFDEVLEEYVSEHGGGLFTVGGSDEHGNANAYNRVDMYNTLYQQLLPVQAINYTPPVGVVVIIDTSGSMTAVDEYGESYLNWAKAGAVSCLDALTERDYMGVMTLSDDAVVKLAVTPVTQRNKILTAINDLEEATGATYYAEAIGRAGTALSTLPVDDRHIIIVSDGKPTDRYEEYCGYIRDNFSNHNITLSIVGIGMSVTSTEYEEMKTAAEVDGHGKLYMVDAGAELIETMRNDLKAVGIKESDDTSFVPTIVSQTSAIVSGVESVVEEGENRMTVGLGGFYGVKARAAADVIIKGAYGVPIYAQWKYGSGTVGSFMSDLNGKWSSEFMANENGKRLVYNIVDNLMPTENIRPSEFTVTINQDNYINQVSVYTKLAEGEYVTGQVIETDFNLEEEDVTTSLNEVTPGTSEELRALACYVKTPLGETNYYSRCNFIIKKSGVYKIVFNKCDAEGNVLASYETYRVFSYSEEYYTTIEEAEITPVEMLETLAHKADGKMIANLDDPTEIFEDFITSIKFTFDPRYLFMILAIVLFLTELAVRKFKFKWPHEIVRDLKNKYASK